MSGGKLTSLFTSVVSFFLVAAFAGATYFLVHTFFSQEDDISRYENYLPVENLRNGRSNAIDEQIKTSLKQMEKNYDRFVSYVKDYEEESERIQNDFYSQFKDREDNSKADQAYNKGGWSYTPNQKARNNVTVDEQLATFKQENRQAEHHVDRILKLRQQYKEQTEKYQAELSSSDKTYEVDMKEKLGTAPRFSTISDEEELVIDDKYTPEQSTFEIVEVSAVEQMVNSAVTMLGDPTNVDGSDVGEWLDRGFTMTGRGDLDTSVQIAKENKYLVDSVFERKGFENEVESMYRLFPNQSKKVVDHLYANRSRVEQILIDHNIPENAVKQAIENRDFGALIQIVRIILNN